MGKVPPGLFFTTLSDGYSDGGGGRDDMENDITMWLWRGLRCLLLWPPGVVVYGRARTICHSRDTDMVPWSPRVSQGVSYLTLP